MLSPRSTFLAAAAVVADTVDLIPSTAWDGPGLGAWDLRALVGHTSRSLITVVEYLGRPAAVEEIATPEAYYAKVAGFAAADPAAVVKRGRAAGAALGDTEILDRLRERGVLTTFRAAGSTCLVEADLPGGW